MDAKKIEQLLNLIDEAVSDDGPWKDKAQAIVSQAGAGQKVNLEEFANWFASSD